MSDEADATEQQIDPTAVVGRRVAGWLVDTILVLGAALVVLVVLHDSFERPGSATDFELRRVDGDIGVFFRSTVAVIHGWELALAAAAGLAVVALSQVLLPAWRSWTPGLFAADLRLVDRDGEPIGLRAALVRTGGWLLDLLPGLPLVGLLAMRFSRHHRRIGDRLAGTYVVDHAFTGRPPTEPVDMESTDTVIVATTVEPSDEPAPIDDGAEVSSVRRRTRDKAPETPEDQRSDSSITDLDGPPDGVDADQPVWDRDHDRYVMWHAKTSTWVAYDDADQSWKPL